MRRKFLLTPQDNSKIFRTPPQRGAFLTIRAFRRALDTSRAKRSAFFVVVRFGLLDVKSAFRHGDPRASQGPCMRQRSSSGTVCGSMICGTRDVSTVVSCASGPSVDLVEVVRCGEPCGVAGSRPLHPYRVTGVRYADETENAYLSLTEQARREAANQNQLYTPQHFCLGGWGSLQVASERSRTLPSAPSPQSTVSPSPFCTVRTYPTVQ